MKFLDKTGLFNSLTAIATVIMFGGDLSQVDLWSLPEWAIPILLVVALSINIYSRSQLKGESEWTRDKLAFANKPRTPEIHHQDTDRKREDPDGR